VPNDLELSIALSLFSKPALFFFPNFFFSFLHPFRSCNRLLFFFFFLFPFDYNQKIQSEQLPDITAFFFFFISFCSIHLPFNPFDQTHSLLSFFLSSFLSFIIFLSFFHLSTFFPFLFHVFLRFFSFFRSILPKKAHHN